MRTYIYFNSYRRDGVPKKFNARRFWNAIRREPLGTFFVHIAVTAKNPEFDTGSHRKRVVSRTYQSVHHSTRQIYTHNDLFIYFFRFFQAA